MIFYQPGTLSALDRSTLADSRDVGATRVFSRRLGERMLTFDATADGFRDRETSSTWNVLGVAERGALAGQRLRAIVHVDACWFAWAAFNPATSVHGQ